MIRNQQKPTLRQLCLVHGIDVLELARASGQNPLLVWSMLIDQPISPTDAQMILLGYCELTRQELSLNDIAVACLREVGSGAS